MDKANRSLIEQATLTRRSFLRVAALMAAGTAVGALSACSAQPSTPAALPLVVLARFWTLLCAAAWLVFCAAAYFTPLYALTPAFDEMPARGRARGVLEHDAVGGKREARDVQSRESRMFVRRQRPDG